MWYATSMSITLLNRIFLTSRFPYPALLTCAHMMLKTVFAAAWTALSRAGITPEVALLPWWPRQLARLQRLRDSQQLSWKAFAIFIVPVGALSGLDVWCSNLALKYISVSLYTVVKGTSVLWSLAFSLCAKLQRPSLPLILTVISLVAGVVLSSMKTVPIEPVGMVAAGVAAAAAAGRWVITEGYMSRPGVVKSVPILMALQGPVSALALVPMLAVEGQSMAAAHALTEATDAQQFVAFVFAGAGIASLLVMLELQLVSQTSALSLNVIGHTKDALVILVSLFVFSDVLSPLNAAGVALTLGASFVYSYLKRPTIVKPADLPASALPSSHRSRSGDRSARRTTATMRMSDATAVDTTTIGATKAVAGAGAVPGATIAAMLGRYARAPSTDWDLQFSSDEEDEGVEDDADGAGEDSREAQQEAEQRSLLPAARVVPAAPARPPVDDDDDDSLLDSLSDSTDDELEAADGVVLQSRIRALRAAAAAASAPSQAQRGPTLELAALPNSSRSHPATPADDVSAPASPPTDRVASGKRSMQGAMSQLDVQLPKSARAPGRVLRGPAATAPPASGAGSTTAASAQHLTPYHRRGGEDSFKLEFSPDLMLNLRR